MHDGGGGYFFGETMTPSRMRVGGDARLRSIPSVSLGDPSRNDAFIVGARRPRSSWHRRPGSSGLRHSGSEGFIDAPKTPSPSPVRRSAEPAISSSRGRMASPRQSPRRSRARLPWITGAALVAARAWCTANRHLPGPLRRVGAARAGRGRSAPRPGDPPLRAASSRR